MQMIDANRPARKLKAVHLLERHTSVFNALVLNEAVTLAATGCRVLVKVDKFKLAKRLKHLLDIALG